MNTFNRILVVLGILVAIPLCIALFLFPVPILQGLGGQMEAWARGIAAQPPVLRVALGVLFSLAWLVICVLFLVLELRRPSPRTARVEKVGGGEVEIGLKSIAERIAYDVDQLPGVLKVRPRVQARRGGVIVEVEVDMAGDFEVPVRGSQVVEVVRRSVEERVGVKLAQPPKVRLRAAPRAPEPKGRPVTVEVTTEEGGEG